MLLKCFFYLLLEDLCQFWFGTEDLSCLVFKFSGFDRHKQCYKGEGTGLNVISVY